MSISGLVGHRGLLKEILNPKIMRRVPISCFGPLLAWTLLGLSLWGCKSKNALDGSGKPTTLLIGVYAGDNPGETVQVLAKVGKYLEPRMGMKVEFTMCTDYTAVIEAIQTHKVHVAYLSPFSYVLATQKAGLIPLVNMGRDGKPFMYTSLILTSPASGLKSMEDVRARAKSLTLCFADPASTSGHLIPRAYLTSIGLDPDTAFKHTMFAGSHAAAVLTVESGKVDLGCAFQYAVDMLIARGKIKKDALRVLWTSDPIVEGPITIRSDINPDFAKRLQKAFLDMLPESPEILKDYLALYNIPSQGVGYVVAQDSQYNSLRKIAGGIKDLDLMKTKKESASK
jgi:phosphonate transport system substrate-binding protein